MHLGSKLSRIVSIDRAFMPICFFSILFPRRFPKGSRLPFFNKYMFTQNVREKNISARPCGRTQKMHRQEAYCPMSIIYIASLLNRHGISCNPCHAVKARHCLVCHAAPRVMVPDSRGCGSVRVKRRNTPCLGDCQENTTLSGGGQPPSPRKSTRLVGIMSLATGLLCLSVSKVALSRDIDRRTVYRISNRYPLSDSGTAYSGSLPSLEPALNVGYLQLVICRKGGK